jgi:hypothetical protein
VPNAGIKAYEEQNKDANQENVTIKPILANITTKPTRKRQENVTIKPILANTSKRHNTTNTRKLQQTSK